MPKPPDNLEEILTAVAGGDLSPAEAAGRLREGEVRYLDEFAALLKHSERAIVSGPSLEQERFLRDTLPNFPARRAGKALVVGLGEPAATGGRVAAVSAGTSDLPVLEEAVAVAREMGVAVKGSHDVGGAGLHRLVGPLEEMRAFDPDCVIVAAGMEGALPSVVSALLAVPVVGLPTSTGYGL